MPNASVLPEPVGASARMSRPPSASGRTSSWTANGRWMLRWPSARTTDVLTPSAWKDCDTLSSTPLEQGFEIQRLEQPEKEEREARSHGGRVASVPPE